MKLRPEYVVVAVAIFLATVLLGSGSLGAVLARTRAPLRVDTRLSGWHGAGPGLPVALQHGPGSQEPAAPPAAPPPVVPAGSGDPYRVDTAPTITVQRIEAVLQEYHSPAVGSGKAFYDLGVQYGINPAVALAFFIHESQAGTQGVARVSKSIGNIRVTPGYRDYNGYRAYDTWEAGIADYYALIRGLYIDEWGLRTVAAILPRYAPPSDNNDTGAYATHVQDLIDSWR